jgi:histidyl-tRNA synthetase
VCAGGRYDGLVEQIGGAATPAFGFAMGMDRLVQILEEQAAAVLEKSSEPDVYLMSIGSVARAQALRLQQELSSSGYEAVLHCGDGGLKNQFKKADKAGAKIGMIIGEQEAAEQTVGIKALQRSVSHSEQQTVSQIDAVNVVTNWLKSL